MLEVTCLPVKGKKQVVVISIKQFFFRDTLDWMHYLETRYKVGEAEIIYNTSLITQNKELDYHRLYKVGDAVVVYLDETYLIKPSTVINLEPRPPSNPTYTPTRRVWGESSVD